MKTIGVLGGMGPAASANLYMKMIKYSQHKYGAVQDSEYPPIVLYSLPLESFDETGIIDNEKVKKQLIEGVQKLEAAGCELIIVGCNTVHLFHKEMEAAVNVPIPNIIEETKKKVLSHNIKVVGLLAAESTNKSNLYQKKFAESDITGISPNNEQQKVINKVIEQVMGGNQKTEEVIALKGIISNHVKKGAEAIVIGCTEIPLALNQTHTDIKLFDAVETIVQKTVDFSLNAHQVPAASTVKE